MKLKLLNAIKCDLNKSIINIGFAGAVLLTTVLAFTSSAYTDLCRGIPIHGVFLCRAK